MAKDNNNKRILTSAFKHLNAFDVLLLTAIISLSVYKISGTLMAGQQPVFQTAVSAVAAILGVFCVVLGAKGSIANWFFGIIEAILHIYICFCTHVYGDLLQRLFYNLPMQFVGLKRWKRREKNDDTASIHTRYMTWMQRLKTLLCVVVGTCAVGLFLQYFGPWFVEMVRSVLPDAQFKIDYDHPMQLWLDSFTTVMSIVAMWISVKAFVEQWYMWLFINVAYIIMWTLSDSAFSFMTVAKYSLYFINSFYGIYTWHKLSKA